MSDDFELDVHLKWRCGRSKEVADCEGVFGLGEFIEEGEKLRSWV